MHGFSSRLQRIKRERLFVFLSFFSFSWFASENRLTQHEGVKGIAAFQPKTNTQPPQLFFFFFSFHVSSNEYEVFQEASVTTPATSAWCYGPVPQFQGRSREPVYVALVRCRTGSWHRQTCRVESCSGGLELVQCPYYPIWSLHASARGASKHTCGRQNNSRI